jgi:Flp pilus assembly protein TadG
MSGADVPTMSPARQRARRGASLVEYALVLPVLLLLAVGVADLSAALRAKHLLVEAAREGARIASVLPNLQANDPRVGVVINDVISQGGLVALTPTWSVDFPNSGSGTAQSGIPVTVTVAHEGSRLSGSGFSPLPTVFTLQGRTTMRYEQRTAGSSTGSASQPPPLPCNCTDWIAQGCGQGSCGGGQVLETRACSPNGCGQSTRCQGSGLCAP